MALKTLYRVYPPNHLLCGGGRALGALQVAELFFKAMVKMFSLLQELVSDHDLYFALLL